jgi:hypothetical protein
VEHVFPLADYRNRNAALQCDPELYMATATTATRESYQQIGGLHFAHVADSAVPRFFLGNVTVIVANDVVPGRHNHDALASNVVGVSPYFLASQTRRAQVYSDRLSARCFRCLVGCHLSPLFLVHPAAVEVLVVWSVVIHHSRRTLATLNVALVDAQALAASLAKHHPLNESVTIHEHHRPAVPNQVCCEDH